MYHSFVLIFLFEIWSLHDAVSTNNYPIVKDSHTSSFFSSVQSLSCVPLFATPRTAARQASLSITSSWSLRKLMSIELVVPSNHLILCRPLLLPSVFPDIRVFSTESVLHIRWPKYWSFSFSIHPSNEYSGLISFRIDWFDLLAVQGILKSLLQHHSSKASVLHHSAFFMVQLSHLYMRLLEKSYFWLFRPLLHLLSFHPFLSARSWDREDPWVLGRCDGGKGIP